MSIMTHEDKCALVVQLRERIAELKETINQLSKADASLRAQNEAQERNAVASAKRIVALKEELDGMLSVNDNANRRIAELEEQLPKVVKPIRVSNGTVSTGFPFLAWTCPECGCRKQVGSAERDDTPIGDKFCSCGVKLNWENT